MICDKKNKEEWNEYVLNSFQGGFYHLFEWHDIIAKTYNHEPFYLLCKKNGKAAGVLPLFFIASRIFGRFLVSLPFCNYGGILADNEDAEKDLLLEAIKIAREKKAGYVELRQTIPLLAGAEKASIDQSNVTMILSLPATESDLWLFFDKKTRNQIRKGEKSGLKAVVDRDLNSFYEIYNRNMRDLGTPVHCRKFFQNIFDTFPDYTEILNVRLKNKSVASMFLLKFKETLYNPWASANRKYFPLCPNDVLYWEALKYAINNKFRYFDFERSQKNSGTHKFKAQWGATEKPLYYYYFNFGKKKITSIAEKKGNYGYFQRIWRIMPAGLTKIIGPRIRKNIP